jgi:Flp pilus assembly protein TadD
MELLRQVEQFRPRSPYPYEMVGEFLLYQGELETARSLFEKSCALVPGRPAAHRRLAMAAAFRGDMEQAKKHLAQARALFPADPKNHSERFFSDLERTRSRISL